MRLRAAAGALAVAAAASACGDEGPTDPNGQYFAQRGHVEVVLETPLRLGAGLLTETLRWSSSGEWVLGEEVSYLGLVGDRTSSRKTASEAGLALAYLSVIQQVNDEEALTPFVDSFSPDSIPECEATESRITFTLADDVRKESVTWIRCAVGSLSNITPEGAGPEPEAARLVLATLLIREATLGARWSSTYLGSVPFGTLDRGDDSASPLTAPVTFIDAGGFSAFWARHAPGRAPPAVDFSRDMVVAALVGARREAGDSVEVRRILQVEGGTVTEVFERVPGDFCAPAARTHVPFHIVVAPRTPIPHRFADVRKELVSCGG